MPDAWSHFESGDMASYLKVIEASVRSAAPLPDVVVLAQASMAGAAVPLRDFGTAVLASPELGVRSALARLRGAA